MAQLPPSPPQQDLTGLARKVIQRMDRRLLPRETGQTLTRIATQINSNLASNAYRILNIKSSGAQVVEDATNLRSNLIIPCGYLLSLVDGGGVAIVASSTKAQGIVHIHDNLRIVQWTIASDVSGSCTIDLKKSTYASWPTTTTIISGTHPNLSSARKNKSTDYIDPATGLVNASWVSLGWTQLNVGDMLELYVTAASTVTRLSLTLQCQAVS